MKRHSRRMAECAMASALGVTLMLVLSLTSIGTYAAPIFASLLLIPLEERYGTGTALTVWAATGLLTLLLATDKELAVVYLAIFGWYPVIRPRLERLPKGISLLAKLALFNAAAVVSYALMLPLLGLEAELGEAWFPAVLLHLGNAVFLLEDRLLIPRLLRVLRQRKRK